MYVALTLLLAACATASISPDIKGCLRRAMAFPLRFAVPNREAEIAWERALAFVSRFSSMNLQVATDYLIETYNPEFAGEFGYSAARAPGIGHWLFEVNCL